jgi:hypothetical protein
MTMGDNRVRLCENGEAGAGTPHDFRRFRTAPLNALTDTLMFVPYQLRRTLLALNFKAT